MRKREEPVEEFVFVEEKRREWVERPEERTELPERPHEPERREVKFRAQRAASHAAGSGVTPVAASGS